MDKNQMKTSNFLSFSFFHFFKFNSAKHKSQTQNQIKIQSFGSFKLQQDLTMSSRVQILAKMKTVISRWHVSHKISRGVRKLARTRYKKENNQQQDLEPLYANQIKIQFFSLKRI